MSVQDRREVQQPNTQEITGKFSRRTLLTAGSKVGLALAAAPLLAATEPIFRPFIDSRGLVEAVEGTPKEGQLPKIPTWVDPNNPELKQELNESHRQFVKMLKYMYGTGYPEFVRVIDEFLGKNGQGREENAGSFAIKETLRLNSKNDPGQKSQKALYVINTGINEDSPNQLNLALYWVNKQADAPQYQPDNLEGMLQFYQARIAIDEYSSIARREKTAGEALSATNRATPQISVNAIRKWNEARQDIINGGLDKQWGLKLESSPTAEIPPEKASAPAEFASADKPTEPSDNTSAEDPTGVKEESIP